MFDAVAALRSAHTSLYLFCKYLLGLFNIMLNGFIGFHLKKQKAVLLCSVVFILRGPLIPWTSHPVHERFINNPVHTVAQSLT